MILRSIGALRIQREQNFRWTRIYSPTQTSFRRLRLSVEVEPQPAKSLKLIEDGRPSHDPMILQVHAWYLDFLFKLCEKTKRIELTSPVRRGLPHVVCRAPSVSLYKDLLATKDLDSYALVLGVYVRLGAALGIQQYVLCRIAVRGRPLKTSTMTFTVSALMIRLSCHPG